MAKIEKLNLYKVEGGKWYGIAFYEDREISVTSEMTEIEKLINEAASEFGDISKMNATDKVKLLTEKGILHREIKDVIKYFTRVYEYDDEKKSKQIIKNVVERISGKTEVIATFENGKMKEEDRGIDTPSGRKRVSITEEIKNTYHLSMNIEELPILEDIGVVREEIIMKKKNKSTIETVDPYDENVDYEDEDVDYEDEDIENDKETFGMKIKNFAVRNWKKTVAILTAGAVLTVGGIHIGKKIQKDKQPEVSNNNPVEDDIYIPEVTPNNEVEIVFDQATPLPTPEPTPTPTVEPIQVPVTSPLCKVKYINQSGESLGEETIDLNATDLDDVFYVGNSEDYGGVDAMGNNLNNPEENAKPEYVNLIRYQNLVQDENDMKYINYLADLRNYVVELYITSSEDQRDIIDSEIVNANRSLVSLIKYDNKELNSGKSFSELSHDAQNIVLKIAQQIYRPLVAVEMNVPYDITNEATGEVQNEFINYEQMAEILVDAYEKVNDGYSR